MVNKFISISAISFFLAHSSLAWEIDCNHPQNIKEKTICYDDALREKSQKLATLLKQPKPEYEKIKKSFEAFLAYKTKDCYAKSCFNEIYDYAINWFEEAQYEQQFQEAQKVTCQIKNLKEECKVYVFSQYNGERLSQAYIDDATENYQTDVKIDNPGQCTILFLSSYEPTIWNLYITPETSDVSVIAGGHYSQMLRGMNPQVETINRRKPDENNKNCLDYYYDKQDILKVIETMNLPAKDITLLDKPLIGQEKPLEQYDFNPQIFDGEYVFLSLPPAEEGIKKLLADGVIRRATRKDREMITQIGVTKVQGFSPDEVDDRKWFRALILQKELEKMPKGLAGGLLVNLFIPKDFPVPDPADGHGDMYIINAPHDVVSAWGEN